MSTLNPLWTSTTTRLSSAGLVYFYHGRQVLISIMEQTAPLGCQTDDSTVAELDPSSLDGRDTGCGEQNMESKSSDHRGLDVIYRKMYENFVEEVDAIDNGIDIADEPRLFSYYKCGCQKQYPHKVIQPIAM